MLIGWMLGMLLRGWRRRHSKSADVSWSPLAYFLPYISVPVQRGPHIQQVRVIKEITNLSPL